MKKSNGSSPHPRRATLRQLERRRQNLLRQIGEIGPVLRGSIGRYKRRCGNPGCRCQADPAALHGPYYLWTRKVSGKTVTRMLSHKEARLLLPWTRNMRRLDRLVTAGEGLIGR